VSLIRPFDPWHSKLCTCPPKLTLNPYTGCDHNCLYCYASSYIPKFYSSRPKKDLIPKLRKEASRLKGEIISIANSSDPYPNMEAETGLMRKCLQILTQQNCKIQIVTKSTLATRDIDLLKRISSMVSLTITTDNDQTAKLIEPNAPPPSKRIETTKTLIERGIPTSVRIDPIIPFLNDNPENLVKILAKIGIKHVTASTYKAKPDNWQKLTRALSPQTIKELEPLYFQKGERSGRYVYLPKDLRSKLMHNLATLAKNYGMKFGTCREGLSQLNTAICDGSWLLSK
jgi:DNA repair photolyase